MDSKNNGHSPTELGRFISRNKTSIMVRVPGTKQVNFHHTKEAEALALRDRLCEQVGRDPGELRGLGNGERRIHTEPHRDKRGDLPVGVCEFNCGRSGILYFRGYWQEEGRTRSRAFSSNRYGVAGALELAIKARECKGRFDTWKG